LKLIESVNILHLLLNQFVWVTYKAMQCKSIKTIQFKLL